MNLINDIKYELEKLNLSKKELKKFGITFGILSFLGLIFFYFKSNLQFVTILLIISSIFFFLLAFSYPLKLKLLYKYWMGIAFFLGWFVSRIILTILFIFIITPIGIILKILKKSFLELSFPLNKTTNWIEKSNLQNKIEKMY